MYEGPIKAVGMADSDGTPILRQLRWTDLVARIAATREFRPAGGTAEELHASFAAFHLDAPQNDPSDDGQQAVNRDVLVHGKFARVATPDAPGTTGIGDREK